MLYPLSNMIRSTLFSAVLSAAMGLIGAQAALACSFHTYIPAETIVDRMLASDHIVLARPDPENPFRFKAVTAVRGSPDEVDLPHLVDSTTRRKMAAAPNDLVLFARDGSYGPWERLTYLDADGRALLDRIVPRLNDWERGEDKDRFALFAEVLKHPDPTLANWALTELDRAPYEVLRSLPINVDAAQLSANMWAPHEYRYLPIRVLLLGLSGDEAARPLLDSGLARSLNGLASIHTGAYATALIELEGPEALPGLAAHLAPQGSADPVARESLIEAMAIHGFSGDTDMQAAVRSAVEKALAADAALAPMVARQFGLRADWSHHERLAAVLSARQVSTTADLIAVSQYVAFARAADRVDQTLTD